MKKRIAFLLVLCSLAASAQAVKKYQVSSESVKTFLSTLSSDKMEGRQAGTPGIEKAAVFLEKFLIAKKIKPYFKTYRDTVTGFRPSTFNIVGYIEGNDPVLKKETIILSAHYDHLGNAEGEDKVYNGANDDASGVTAVAELASYFATTKSNKRSIIIAFFTAEEKGLLGSTSFAKKLRKANVKPYAMLNFEMIGVPLKDNYTAYLTGYNMTNMAELLNKAARKHYLGYFPGEKDYDLFSRSDNYAVYSELGIPAQTVSTFTFQNYKFYHEAEDEADKLDITHMTAFIQQMIPMVEYMATSPKQEIILYEK